MQASQASRVSQQIRVVRVSRPSVRPIKREEHVETQMRSSVDSWLSSAPSIKEPKTPEIRKKIITPPPTIKNKKEEPLCRPGYLYLIGIILIVLLICSIVGIVLAVKLQSTASNSGTTTTSSH